MLTETALFSVAAKMFSIFTLSGVIQFLNSLKFKMFSFYKIIHNHNGKAYLSNVLFN
jgi:hypothetical protein